MDNNNSAVLQYIQEQLEASNVMQLDYDDENQINHLSKMKSNKIEPFNQGKLFVPYNTQRVKARKKKKSKNRKRNPARDHQVPGTRPLRRQSTFIPKFESSAAISLKEFSIPTIDISGKNSHNLPGKALSTNDFDRSTEINNNMEGYHSNLNLAKHFEVIWQNLVYYHPKGIKKSKNTEASKEPGAGTKASRPALNNISGSIRSGQMTAIMGPSGAGKTVFLNCLTGHLSLNARKENSGVILINGVKSIRVGFVEQFDNLLPHLSIRETLVFASRIKNAARYYLNHGKVVDEVIQRLDLKDCADIRAGKCSNGQRKRLSIAIEMCFNSDILILDEPTTGMDAVTGYQIMHTLKALINRRKAISVLATIHQPSPKLFALFDNLIVFSRQGTLMYQGSPRDLPITLSMVGLRCPMYTNLSDFMLEIASGDYGFKKVQLLAHYNREYSRQKAIEDRSEVEIISLQEAVRRSNQINNRSFLICTWLLFVRTLLCNLRNPFNTQMRVASVIGMSIFLGVLFTDAVGQVSTCAPTKYFLWRFDLENILEEAERQQLRIRENLSVVFMLVQVSLFNSLLTIVVTIAEEVEVFHREYFNNSYSILSWYIAKIMADFPFTISATSVFMGSVYYSTGQVQDQSIRVYMCIFTCCIMTFIGQLMGMTIGLIFSHNTVASVYSVIVILIPLFLFSGFFRAITDINWFLAQLSWVSFFRQALNAMLISIYGLNRCEYENELYYSEFLAKNITEAQGRPKWINSMVTLLTVQSEMSESTDSNSMTAMSDETLESEEKLIRYMGMGIAGLNKTNDPLILQHFHLNTGFDAFWHEISILGVYISFFAVVLYLVMWVRISRKK